MKHLSHAAALLSAVVLGAGCGDQPTSPSVSVLPSFSNGSSGSSGSKHGFGFNGTASGFPTGAVFLTGGGAYDPSTGSNTVPSETFVHSGGGFRCTADVGQGPLKGCAAGEGVRWDTAQLLASTVFKCTGSDAAKPAATSDHAVVLLADFYRAGDGIECGCRVWGAGPRWCTSAIRSERVAGGRFKRVVRPLTSRAVV